MIAKRSQQLRLVAAVIILSTCIGCDQVTKGMATHLLLDAPPYTYLDGAVRIEYALNPGGFLSLGSGVADEFRPWIFIGLNSCLLLGLGWFLFRRQNLPYPLFVAMLFILAGGIGNLIDRMSNNGLVTDFINVGIGQLRTGIFNVADMLVTFGATAAVFLTQRPKDVERSHTVGPPDGSVCKGRSSPPAR
jgi:signal peptidase II